MGSKDSPGTLTPKGWYSRRHMTQESHDTQVQVHALNYVPKRNPPQPPYNTHKK